MLNEACFALYEGIGSVEDIDTAIQLGLNHPMGPFALMDLIGLDTTLAILEVLHRELGDPQVPALPAAAPVRRGRAGSGARAGAASTSTTRRGARRRGRSDDGVRTIRSRAGGARRRGRHADRQPSRGAQRARRPDRRRADRARSRRSIDDAGVRCAILTGAGDSAFVAGADIKAMAGAGRRRARARSPSAATAWRDLMEGMRVPVIAAVNGFALGGGLRAGARLRLHLRRRAPPSSGSPRSGLGVIPGFGGTQRLARRVGVARARELIYHGRDHRRRRGAAHRPRATPSSSRTR